VQLSTCLHSSRFTESTDDRLRGEQSADETSRIGGRNADAYYSDTTTQSLRVTDKDTAQRLTAFISL